MLRVLSLNYEYPPIGGGGGNAHKHLLSELSHFYDLQITLVTSTDKSDPYSERIARNVQGHFLPLPKEDLSFWKRTEVIRYLLTHYGFLHSYLKQISFDLCHAFFGFPAGLLAYHFSKKVPYIVSVRGSDVPGYNARFTADYVFLRPLLKRIYQNSRQVVANSHGLKTLFENQFPGIPAMLIPNGVDTDMFSPGGEQFKDDFSIVTVARLIPRKGIDILLHACLVIEKWQIPFQCHIVGHGPEETNLKNLTSELNLTSKVHFHGRMDKIQISRLLPKCNVFVLPSYAEGMSNAALEAMACGLPLILTETGGSMELINGNGEIVPSGNVMALANSINNLFFHPELLHEMASRSRKLAEQMSWHNVAQQYHDLFCQTMGL